MKVLESWWLDWRVGRFCPCCKLLANVRPKPADFAYNNKDNYVADMDEAIGVLCG